MLLLTTECVPEEYEIKEMFSMIQTTSSIKTSKKGLIEKYTDRNRNEYQEALEQLASFAPAEATAVIGIKVSTTTQVFSNGTYLVITYIGTPVELVKKNK